MAVTTDLLREPCPDPDNGHSGRLRPLVMPLRGMEDAPRGDIPLGGPYDTREWKGMTVHQCPECAFPGTSVRGVDKHRVANHPEPPTTAERAAASGIIVATR